MKRRSFFGRLIPAMLVVVFCVTFLTGFGTPKEVPTLMLDWLVEDRVKEVFEPLGSLPEYSYEATHAPDSSTQSDTVHVELTLKSDHFTVVNDCNCTYVYDKSSGLWTLTRGGKWSTPNVLSYNGGPFTMEAVHQAFGNHGFKLKPYRFTSVSAEELEKLTTPEIAKSIKEAWHTDQMDDDSEIMCASFTATDYDTAKGIYSDLIIKTFGGIDLTGENVKEFGTIEGDDYFLSGFVGSLYDSNVTAYFVCVDEFIFLTYGAFEKDKGLQYDQVMYELGILPLAQMMTGRIS